MTILFNTDHNIQGREGFKIPFIEQIEDALERFSSRITRVEAHLTDDSSKKESLNDKRCVLEAHVAGMNPVVVTAHGDSYEEAVDAGVAKLKMH